MLYELTQEQIDALLALLAASIFAARSPDGGRVVVGSFELVEENFFLLPEISMILVNGGQI